VSFKKNKIISSEESGRSSLNFSKLKNQYLSLKKRNFFSGMFLGIFALSCIVAISFTVFANLPSFHFDFSAFQLGVGGNNLFEKVQGSEKGKINILLTGM